MGIISFLRQVLRAMITFLQVLLVCGYLLSALVFWVGDGWLLELQLLFPLVPLMLGLSLILWVGEAILFQRGRMLNLVAVVLGVMVILLFYGTPAVHVPSLTSKGPSLKVLSWNAQQLGNDTAKVQQAIERIRLLDPDVVLLQEFGLYYKWPDVSSVAQDFSERTGLPHYDFTPHPGNIFGTACFSKYPILEVDTLFQLLSMTNEAKRYTVQFDDAPLTLVNAHLMSYNLYGNAGVQDRRSIAELVAARTNQASQVLGTGFDLLFGDLNAVPGDAVYEQLTTLHHDAFSGWLTPTHHQVPVRIDHCFYSDDWRVVEADYISDLPSDHKALLVVFERKN